MRDTLPDRVRLGVFEVDLRVGELRSADQTIRLQEQPLQILCMLVERDGDLVTREEIQKKLWPNDTVVEFDRSINAAIKKLRQAFGDSADEPVYVETIHRRGYRLLVRVKYLVTNNSSDLSVAPEAARPTERPLGATDLIGKKVSHYRVLEVIGGGGMGLVYKAEDLKLGRQVALKFLPEELAFDSVALQRFEREAQTASSLNHPNICTIHEVEEHEGQPFIVMELLEGETLRDGLARAAAKQKLLPLDQLLDIAMQVSAGLEAAHKRVIIHRDIKPANIFVTSSDQVKILDFGLAKLATSGKETGSDHLLLAAAAGAGTQPARPPMETTLTRVGAAMGTAGYMSPEQVRGEQLDPRTDIFSFGLVLYEMATGQRAFTGETAAVVQDATVNRTPAPARELNPAITPELEAVINKALEKNREQRYQTAAELGTDLRRLKSDTGLDHAAASSQGRRRGALWLALSLLILLAAIAIARLLPRRAEAPPPEVKETQLTANPLEDYVTSAGISPDGKYVAYHDQTGLYLRSIDSGETRPITVPAELRGRIYYLCWFPTGGKLLADVAGSKGYDIWVITVFGQAQPQLLYRNGGEPAISPDGRRIAFTSWGFGKTQQEVWVGGANGEAPRKLVDAKQFQNVFAPTWSPDGHWIAYAREWKTAQGSSSSAIEVRPTAGGPAKTLVDQSSLPQSNTFVHWFYRSFSESWSPDWRVVFSVVGGPESKSVEPKYSLWEVRVEPGTGKAVGEPERLTQWSDSELLNLTITADGKRLSLLKVRNWWDAYVGELGPGGTSMRPPHRLTLDDRGSYLTYWTPDSRAILFHSAENGRSEIFRQGLNDRAAELIVAGPGDVYSAGLSPEGSWLIYVQSESTSLVGGAPSDSVWLMRRSTGGGSPERLLKLSEADAWWCSYNPNAKSPCVVSVRKGNELVFYSLDPVRGQGDRLTKIEVSQTAAYIYWSLSPDGSRLALVDPDKYGGQIKVLTLSDGSWHEIALEPGAGRLQQILWAADGKSFFGNSQTQDSSTLLHITTAGRVQPLLRNGDKRQLSSPLPSPDGKYLAFRAQTWDSNAWMIDNF